MLTQAPLIETPRLILRQYRLDDFAPLVACWQDPEMVRHIGDGQPQSAEMSWARMTRHVGHWQLMGYGYWAVEEKQSGKLVGSFGIQQAHRDITPALEYPEAGWSLIPAAQGKGYAQEALKGMLAWIDSHQPGPLCCIINEDNPKSLALAARCGFHLSHMANYHGKPVCTLIRQPQG